MADYALQRLNMVESQVRPSNLTDRRIAGAMLEVPREAFLPGTLHGVAYSDKELRLRGIDDARQERAMLAPRTLAQMIQCLELDAGDVVLLVGAGSGYEAAIMAHIVQMTVVLEADPGLAAWAEGTLGEQEVSNAVVVTGPLTEGYASEGPFDAILINGGVEDVPAGLLDQLKDGGRLTAVRRTGGMARLVVWQRVGEQYSLVEKGAAAADMLTGFAKEASFAF